MALLCALWLATPALGAGFEGLRRDDPGPLAVAGEIDAVDADERSFRIGGLTFTVPPAMDFDDLRPGRFAEVTYTDQGDRHVPTRIRFREVRPQ
jgi:hypothetical protein